MKKTYLLWYYALLFFGIIGFDRISKYWILSREHLIVNQYLSFHLVFNRGISWGMFHSEHPIIFLIISLVIGLFIGILGTYIAIRWLNHQVVFAELAILAGALSNMFDRLWYGGVIDFIVLSFDGISFPAFNIADSVIVIGVLILATLAFLKR